MTEEFPQPAVASFLADIIEDVATRRLHTLTEDTAFTCLYRINVILPHAPDEACPMVIESAPTMTNLLALVEREFLAEGMVHSDHLMIHAGRSYRPTAVSSSWRPVMSSRNPAPGRCSSARRAPASWRSCPPNSRRGGQARCSSRNRSMSPSR